MFSVCLAALAPSAYLADVRITDSELVLGNGLVERRVYLKDFVTTTSLRRLDTGQEC
jgi:hypothetical protein